MAQRSKNSIAVRRDNATVRINKTEAVKNGKTYVNFDVNHYEKGQRRQ